MKNTRVLISGASIGGPAMAFWLHRYGFDVTVVEKADTIRAGGQAVDFKGPIHRTVLERMGILDEVKAANVPNADGTIVNAQGRKIGTVPGEFAGGEINVPRGDLAGILYRLTADRVTYIFGDSISTLSETDSGIDVTFVSSQAQTFDLVIGADGMHSNVRELAFGPESDYVHHLGYYYVLAGLDTGEDEMLYNEPGRMAAIGGTKAPAFFIFTSDVLPPARDDVALQKQQAVDALSGGRWRMPELVAKIPTPTSSTWTPSVAPRSITTAGGEWRSSATPPTETRSAGSGPACLSWVPTSLPVSWPWRTATTNAPSTPTRTGSATTPRSRRRSTPGG